MKPPRILPIPPAIEALIHAHPVAFDAGAMSARAGEHEDCNPYSRAAERNAWAAGWVAVREDWIELVEGEA